MSLVTVVIPVFNAGRYLKRCIDSILGQSHSDLQVICVDDGSTDDSMESLRAAALPDGRVRVLTQPNAGPGRARNTALAEADGDYLMFVDADDIVPPQAVERLLGTITESGSDIVSGRVLRLAGTMTWPSPMHERALQRARTRTHLFRDTALLYDTTPWNKLFRHSFWRANAFRFPEGVYFEDVGLMVEAHCRAISVDVIDDVVYHWRRRDDGILSITMRRQDPLTLEHRIASMQRIRRLIRRIAPVPVQQAAELKFLKNDLGLYLPELTSSSDEFLRYFVDATSNFITDTPSSALSQLPTEQRVSYHLIGRRDYRGLIEFLSFLDLHGGTLPIRRRGLGFRAEVGPAVSVIPRALADVHRLPLRTGVDAVHWVGDDLVIEGYGFLDGVPYNHPAAAIRRVKLLERRTGATVHKWLMPRRHAGVTARHGTEQRSYRWSGFRLTIPLRQLDPGSSRDWAIWEVTLQALIPGAASGSALGPPRSGAAWFTPVKHDESGLVISTHWAAEHRLELRVKRAHYRISVVEQVGDQLRIGMRCNMRQPDRPDKLLLARSSSADAVVMPLTWSGPTDRNRSLFGYLESVAWLNLDQVRHERGGLPHLAFRFLTQTAEQRPAPVSVEFPQEVAYPVGSDTLLIREDGSGCAEAVLVPARVSVKVVYWRHDRLVLAGVCTLPGADRPRLAWRNGAGEQLDADELRVDDTFQATFCPLGAPSPEGPHRLASGRWSLMRATPGGFIHVVAARGSQAELEEVQTPTDPNITIWVDRHSRVSMQVHALPLRERGAFAQNALRKKTYRAAIRSSLVDVALIECWQGKQFGDNPRALVESAIRSRLHMNLAVVVKDRSIVVPAGTRQVLRWSSEYYDLLGRAKLVIANDSLTSHYIKRAGQRYLQTWHGTPLKRIGLDVEHIHFRNKNYMRELLVESSNWDWLVSPNSYSTEIMRRAFAYDKPVLETGYPRNDVLAGGDGEEQSRRRSTVRTWFHIPPEATVWLWAPTWRDDAYAPEGGYSAGLMVDLEEFLERIPCGSVVLFRGHHLTMHSQRAIANHHGRFLNVSTYPDLRDLILASDALMTDYSSIMFDYVLTTKPTIFFAPDLDHYQRIRGLYCDIEDFVPGPVVTTTSHMLEYLDEVSALREQYAAARATFRQRFCAFEDGHASDRVWETILSEVV